MTLLLILLVLALFAAASVLWGADSRDSRYSMGAMLSSDRSDDRTPAR